MEYGRSLFKSPYFVLKYQSDIYQNINWEVDFEVTFLQPNY